MTRAGVVTRTARGLAAALLVAVGLGGIPRVGAADAGRAKADPVGLAALSAGLTADQQAELRFLEHLGWTFVRDPAAKEVAVHGGTPCYRRDAEAMKGGGDLRVTVPAAVADPAAFGRTVSGLADAVATRCAFKQKVAVAVREATRKLTAIQEAGEFTFPKWLIVDAPVFRCALPEPEWRKVRVENVCAGLPSKAIEAVYERGGVAECYTAQWLSLFATQYEMYGPAWFDQVFTKEELRVGRPQEAYESAIGQYVDETRPYAWRSLLITDAESREDPAVVLARHGPKAFAGLTGVLQNTREYIGANQNFTIVSVSPRAAEELRARGLGRYIELTTEAMEVRRNARVLSATERSEHRAKRAVIYGDPVMSEVRVYVHPYGVIPLGEIIEEELSAHLRPIKIRIYTNGLDEFFYQRYRTAWKQRWLRENAAAVVAPPSVPAGDAIPASPPAPSAPPPVPPPVPPDEQVPTRPPPTQGQAPLPPAAPPPPSPSR